MQKTPMVISVALLLIREIFHKQQIQRHHKLKMESIVLLQGKTIITVNPSQVRILILGLYASRNIIKIALNTAQTKTTNGDSNDIQIRQ